MSSKRTAMAVSALSTLLLVLPGCGGGDQISTAGVKGTITINGKPVEGVTVKFVPKEKIRPATGMTDAEGHYEAQFLANQSGVPLGPCVAQISLYKGDDLENYIPAEFNEKAAENPDLNLEIFKDGLVFDYDVKFDGELPNAD